MKRYLFTIRHTVIFMIKAVLYISLGAAFFLIMKIDNWQLLLVNRTTAITLSSFVVIGLALSNAYGRFDIGKRKSKPIITSMALATALTDIITYIQLLIMNTNDANNRTFRITSLGLLILAFVVQFLLIVAITYFGNFVFFKFNKPESVCIVTDSETSLAEIAWAVCAFRKQYCIQYARHYDSGKLFETLLKCDTVFLYNVPPRQRTEIMEFCYRNLKNIYISPEISDIVEINAKHVILDDISLISAPVSQLTFEQRFFKRTMDIILSALALIICSPLLLGCAIAIKLGDGGPVFFKQQRATKGGRVFWVYKFRTMKEHVKNYSATGDDDRITAVGRVLRKNRLDELPQFFNILKGEMSIVGPRPEMLENVYNYTKDYPEFSYRLRVKAGLTGYAQIAGKYNTTPKYKLILDLMYIENYNMLKDLKLILQTLLVLFRPDSTEGFARCHVPDLSYLTPKNNDWYAAYEALVEKEAL